MADPAPFIADLEAEHDALDARVANLTAADWLTSTPAEGWDIRDTISHLHFFDARAVDAIVDPAGFEAHAESVRAALGLPPVVSSRLHAVCHIGVGARGYAFFINGIEDPGDPVRVELQAPDGNTWSWGPMDAVDRIEGPALDFALVFTQRRHRDDTALKVHGATAEQWIGIAQAYAGAAGTGRTPLGQS